MNLLPQRRRRRRRRSRDKFYNSYEWTHPSRATSWSTQFHQRWMGTLHEGDDQSACFQWKLINLKPPKALLEVKPQPYYPKILTIGLLYKILEPSPIDNCKALCGNKFKERHGISAVEDLMQDLTPHNLHLPQSDFDWLQLLAERTFMNSSQLKNTTLINICEHLLDSSIFHALKHSKNLRDNLSLIRFYIYYTFYICCTSVTALL